jgi:NADH dehydrogenase [ubiquinone] 1 alpha subcomplex assembly factor 7
LEGLIKFRGGPVTFAEYMQTALSSPVGGYYGNRYLEGKTEGGKGEDSSVIGARGDFVTSPEISQLFGEMVGLWCVTVWQQLGCPKTLRLVELGPGKGTLMADLLRSTKSPSSPIFKAFQDALMNGPNAGVHFVEISPFFRKSQAKALSAWESEIIQNDVKGKEENEKENELSSPSGKVKWYRTLGEIPNDHEVPTIYIGHEFLDALPVHMFVKKSQVWTEILVDLKKQQAISLDPDAQKNKDPEFEMKLSPGATPAMKMLLTPKLESLNDSVSSNLKEMEISASAMEHTLELGKRLVSNKAGGAVLFIDYGYTDLPGRFTCRAIHAHKVLDDLLELTGAADLTADVDFGALKWAIENNEWDGDGGAPTVHGPVSQAKFLQSLGIEYRLQNLLKNTKMTKEQAEGLILGYKRLVSSEAFQVDAEADGRSGEGLQVSGMGEVYKAMAITSFPEQSSAPVGF